MFHRMLGFLRIRKKHVTTTDFPAYYPDASPLHSPSQRPDVKGKLVLPTSLEEVAAAAHRNKPQQLPAEDATEDDVRYFLFEVLTHKDHGLVRQNPQWILETCMSWHGDGHLLRSLPFDSYQQLCPLYRGHAVIDPAVKCPKFPLKDMPPCGTRDRIAAVVRTAVTSLKSSETGHRSPGWQNSKHVGRLTPSRSTTSLRAQKPSLTMHPGHRTHPFGDTPAYPIREQFYGLGNQSAPQFNSAPSLSICKDPFFTQHEAAFILPQRTPSSIGPLNDQRDPEKEILPPRDDRQRRLSAPRGPLSPAPLPSPALSCAYSGRTMSKTSDSNQLTLSIDDSLSTAKSSPPISEDENHCRFGFASRSQSTSQSTDCSISQSSMAEQYSPSGTYQATALRASVGTPSRYKMRPDPHRDPHRQTTHLPNSLCNTTAMSHSSFMTSSYDVIDQFGYQRDSAISPEVAPYPLHHGAFLHPSVPPTSSYVTMLQSCPTPPQQLPSPITPGAANLTSCSHVISVRPSNRYAVDEHAFGAAELVDHKSRPAPDRSTTGDQGKSIRRGKSHDDVHRIRMSVHGNSANGQDTVGPHIRFRDPQTGAPRLTMVETIEQRQRLGKQRLEGQRRVGQPQRRLKTVYETIEEQEGIGGRPQRGVDDVQHEWASYH